MLSVFLNFAERMVYLSASFYYVRYSVLGKIIRYCYTHFHWRVWLLSGLFIFLFFINQLLHLLFRLLDEIFHRGYRKQKVEAPVFIIANPRSGTTFLHRLMTMDEQRFAYTKFAHTFFMTSSFVQFYNVFRWVDKHLFLGGIRAMVNKLDDKLYGGWDDIHNMGFNQAEEDELPFAQMLNTPGVLIPFPYMHLIKEVRMLDNEPSEVREHVMSFYESCVKRFLFRAGTNKTYLAKNVMSTGRWQSLLKKFPDARIIYIARHPYDAVPSMASMFTVMYDDLVTDMPADAPARTAWIQLAIDFFKSAQQLKHRVPPAHFYSLKYDDLVAQPAQTIAHIYEHFGWQISAEQHARLAMLPSRAHHSAHEYSLEEFALTKTLLNNELKEVMEEFGFAQSE